MFNSESKKCIKNEQLASQDDPLEFSLPHGTYDVYAIGGVDESIYTLPSEKELTEETEITLKENKEHADLMTEDEYKAFCETEEA